MTDYQALNRANWDERAAAHAASADYGFARFAADPAHLSKVVRFDMPRLGDISGLRGVHLQCHIGTDTVSLSRLGATMTGVDFSGESLAVALSLAAAAGADVTYVQSDVYDAPAALGGATFDLVYTGIGALCWLPDIRRWAPPRWSGTTGSARSSPRSWTPAWRSPGWSSTSPFRGRPCPGG